MDSLEPAYRRLTPIFWVGLVAFVLAFFGDYGITYDEPKDHEYGRLLWNYYLSGFRDRSLFAYHDLKIYGGLFEMIAWPTSLLLPFGEYATRHLINAGWGLLGIAAAFRLGSMLGGAGGGFWAALLLTFCPQYLGHMFNNPKDIPYAAGYAWSLYYMIRAYSESPTASRATILKFGLAIGFTLAIRIGALMLFAIFVPAMAYKEMTRRGAADKGSGAVRLGLQIFTAAIAAWPVMIVFWPYALINPVGAPLEALSSFSRFPWEGSILFGGRLVSAANLPWDYIPRLLILKTPEIILPLVAAGIFWLLLDARAGRSPRAGGPILLIASVVAPVAYAILMKSVLYNGMRHFLFILPPICVLAGLALTRILNVAYSVNIAAGRILAGAVGLYLIWQAGICAMLHPHEMTYYNLYAGGLRGAFNRYELDYWGGSYKELVERFKKRYENEEGKRPRACRVYVTGPYDSAGKYLPEYCSMEAGPSKADFAFFLVNTSPPTGKAPVYAVVQRFGVPLAYAIDLRTNAQRTGVDNRP